MTDDQSRIETDPKRPDDAITDMGNGVGIGPDCAIKVEAWIRHLESRLVEQEKNLSIVRGLRLSAVEGERFYRMRFKEARSRLARAEAENAKLRDERDDARSLLASVCDLLNSWARSFHIEEAENEKGIKKVVQILSSKSFFLWTDRDRLRDEVKNLRDLTLRGIDVERVRKWMKDPSRKPANLAFTDGPERQAAYLIEMSMADLCDELDQMRAELERVRGALMECCEVFNLIEQYYVFDGYGKRRGHLPDYFESHLERAWKRANKEITKRIDPIKPQKEGGGSELV